MTTAVRAGARGSVQHRVDRDQQVATLFELHYAGLWRLATLLLGDAAAAEEAVQEAFVRTYAGWWRLRRPESARWYLRAAVVNECRSRGRRRAVEDRSNRLAVAGEREATEPEAERRGELQLVLQAVRSLPARQREAVVLRYYEDLPEAAIARTLRCSVGTVKSQLSKARATLAGRLTEAGLAPTTVEPGVSDDAPADGTDDTPGDGTDDTPGDTSLDAPGDGKTAGVGDG